MLAGADSGERRRGELEILRPLAEGLSYKAAADAASTGLDTMRFHVRNIYEKLHVHAKSEPSSRRYGRDW